MFPGALILIPALVTYYRGTERVQGAAKIAGRESVNGWIVLILYLLLAPGMWFYLQSSLNEVWEQEGDAPAGQGTSPAQAEEMPPRL